MLRDIDVYDKKVGHYNQSLVLSVGRIVLDIALPCVGSCTD